MDWDKGGREVAMWGRWPRTHDKRGRKTDFRFVYPPGRARVLDSRGVVCCFNFIMAAVQTEPNLCSQPCQRPFYIYGGLACNSLMAGKFFFFVSLTHSDDFCCLKQEFCCLFVAKILMYIQFFLN